MFLNYGGPGGSWISQDEKIIQQLDQECKNFYGSPIRKVSYEIKGITVTVCTYGIHRSLHLEIPKNASEETKKLFDLAFNEGRIFCSKEYHLLSNNCVTAVAKILNILDNKITPANVVYPWSLDANIKKYCGNYDANIMASQFIAQYQSKVHQEFFSFIRKRHWTKERIKTTEDIILHSYGKTGGTGERTKSTLLKLGWVTEDKNHVLRPTNKAPLEFKAGLEKYNNDYDKVLKLKNLYKHNAGIFSRHAHVFFKDKPDYATALGRLKKQALKNPSGASAKVLSAMS